MAQIFQEFYQGCSRRSRKNGVERIIGLIYEENTRSLEVVSPKCHSRMCSQPWMSFEGTKKTPNSRRHVTLYVCMCVYVPEICSEFPRNISRVDGSEIRRTFFLLSGERPCSSRSQNVTRRVKFNTDSVLTRYVCCKILIEFLLNLKIQHLLVSNEIYYICMLEKIFEMVINKYQTHFF